MKRKTHWNTGSLEYWNIWTLDHWNIGTLKHLTFNLHLVTSIALILFKQLRVTLVTSIEGTEWKSEKVAAADMIQCRLECPPPSKPPWRPQASCSAPCGRPFSAPPGIELKNVIFTWDSITFSNSNLAVLATVLYNLAPVTLLRDWAVGAVVQHMKHRSPERHP